MPAGSKYCVDVDGVDVQLHTGITTRGVQFSGSLFPTGEHQQFLQAQLVYLTFHLSKQLNNYINIFYHQISDLYYSKTLKHCCFCADYHLH